MIKRILAALVGLSLTSLVFAQSPSLFFKEVWTINGAAHAITPGENVLTNANLELKLYGPSATAADPDKRIWISTPPANIWTGMTTTPLAATLRDKEHYVDLTGMAKVRWITRASGFHVVHPVVFKNSISLT